MTDVEAAPSSPLRGVRDWELEGALELCDPEVPAEPEEEGRGVTDAEAEEPTDPLDETEREAVLDAEKEELGLGATAKLEVAE